MADQHKQMIWQGGPARQIMAEARKRFRDARYNPKSAHVVLASTHYSLIKRYKHIWWQKPLAAWHAWRAADNATLALVRQPNSRLTSDEVDVISRIMAKVPEKLGGDPQVAMSLLYDRLFIVTDSQMSTHTRALMLVTLAEIEWTLGGEARKRAWEKQRVRVMKSVGFFQYFHGGAAERYYAERMVAEAAQLADQVSPDQAASIRQEMLKFQHGR
jgi:hypothetical protein